MILPEVQGRLRSLAAFGQRLVEAARGRPSADRELLERTILPSYARRSDVERVLFVGCARYTHHYEDIFKDVEYWTLDPARWRRRWGAQRHIVGRLERLGDHVAGSFFDVIVCNGVLGWGLNHRRDVEDAFDACHHALRGEGELVLGWNDIAPRNHVRPESIRALARFEQVRPCGFDGWRVAVPGAHRHVFDFYRKRGYDQAGG